MFVSVLRGVSPALRWNLPAGFSGGQLELLRPDGRVVFRTVLADSSGEVVIRRAERPCAWWRKTSKAPGIVAGFGATSCFLRMFKKGTTRTPPAYQKAQSEKSI